MRGIDMFTFAKDPARVQMCEDQFEKLIDDLYVSSGEQAQGVDQIAKAVTQAGQITQSWAASAEEAASAGEELSAQASALEAVVARLESLVGAAADGRS